MEIVVDHSLRAEDVAEVEARLVAHRCRLDAINVDKGSWFSGNVKTRWAYENGVELDFSRRGTPTDNAMVKSFNCRLRRNLNERWFLWLADARSKIEAWRRFCNEKRTQSALAWKIPAEFARAQGSHAKSLVPKHGGISTSLWPCYWGWLKMG